MVEETQSSLYNCIIIVIIIIIIIISYHLYAGIYSYIPGKTYFWSHLCCSCFYLQFMLHVMLLLLLNVLYLYISTPRSNVQCPIWLLYRVPCFCAFPVCCLGIFWMILSWFLLSRLLYRYYFLGAFARL